MHLSTLILFVTGIFVGGINAIAGAGMLVGFPVLTAFGMSALVANATGKLVALPGQITAAFGYGPFLSSMPRRYFFLFVPVALGSVSGALILRDTPSKDFGIAAPLLIVLALIMFIAQPYIERRIDHGRTEPYVLPYPLLSAGLFLTSVYAGFFGIGYGLMLLSIMSFSGMKSIHHMNVFKNLAGSLMLLAGLIVLAPGPFVDWTPGFVMGLGSGVGGYLTARIAPRISTEAIRTIIILFSIASVLYFIAGNHL